MKIAFPSVVSMVCASFDGVGWYRIQHASHMHVLDGVGCTSPMRYLDAYTNYSDGYAVVLRDEQDANTQWWYVSSQSDGAYRIQQRANLQYLDGARSDPTASNRTGSSLSIQQRAVVRGYQDDVSQHWAITPTKNTESVASYNIQQMAFAFGTTYKSSLYLDGSDNTEGDFVARLSLDTRGPSREWVFTSWHDTCGSAEPSAEPHTTVMSENTVQLASHGVMLPGLVGIAVGASVVGLGAAVMPRKAAPKGEPLVA